MVSQRQGVLNFLSALVVDLNVSQQGTHVAMGTFTLTSHTKFEFDSHLNSDDLRAAIVGVRFNGGIGDSTAGLAYILNHALKSSSNRPNVPDAVVFITDDKATKVLAQLYGKHLHQDFIAHHARTQKVFSEGFQL